MLLQLQLLQLSLQLVSKLTAAVLVACNEAQPSSSAPLSQWYLGAKDESALLLPLLLFLFFSSSFSFSSPGADIRLSTSAGAAAAVSYRVNLRAAADVVCWCIRLPTPPVLSFSGAAAQIECLDD